jgi:hypothetical protein
MRAVASFTFLLVFFACAVDARAEGDPEVSASSDADAAERSETEAADPDFTPDLVLARMAENPVSGIVRFPVANGVFFGIPPNDGVGYALVLAPVLPVLFKRGWSFLTRVTIPAFLTLPVGPNRVNGFGNIRVEMLGHKFFRGKKGQLYDLGFGPYFGFPTATDDFLGSDRWEVGPAIALGISAKRVVTVLIARNQFSVGQGTGSAKVNQLFLQYFLFYNLPKLFYLVYEPVILANWEATTKERWTVPVGLGFGRHHRLPRRRRLSITTRLSGLYNAVRPSTSPSWEILATLVFWKPNPAVFDAK